MLTEGGLPLSLSAAVSYVGSGSPIMCGVIKKKRASVQTGVQKTRTQILSTNNGMRWCVGIHICGLEDYLSKWTYCAVGNELRPPPPPPPFLYLSCLDGLDAIGTGSRENNSRVNCSCKCNNSL